MNTSAAIGAAAGAYHGYKRSRGSVTSALLWGIAASFAPLFVFPVAVLQGFGKPAE